MRKNCKFSSILQKVTSYLYAISINLYKIEAPNCTFGSPALLSYLSLLKKSYHLESS
jgi:hypothetical protein